MTGVIEGRTIIAQDRSAQPNGGGAALWLVLAEGVAPGVALPRGGLAQVPGIVVAQEFGPGAEIGRAACFPAGDPLLELVVDGLSFDLCARVCDAEQLRGAGERREVVDALRPHAGRHAMCLVPGPHLSAAATSLAVTRAQIDLGARIASTLAIVDHVVWPPAEWSVDPGEFDRATAAWRGGGAFAAPGLVQFRPTLDGSVQSVGLAHFTGQELRIEGGMAADPSHAHRLAARLAGMLVHRGRLVAVEEFAGPSGEQLRLEPSANGRYVRARLG